MTRLTFITLAPFSFVLAACQSPEEAPIAPAMEASPEVLGSADLIMADGSAAGTMQLLALGDEVMVSADLTKLPAGTHAIHLHMTGACEAPDFKSAGGHLNPSKHEHGTENPKGAHLGDLPNLEVAEDGAGHVATALRGTKDSVIAALFDADGTAIVVHERADDNMSDPSGNAGGRIACGVVKPA